MPSAFAEARPLAFKPPSGFLPSLRCQAALISSSQALHIFTIDQFAQLADSVGNKIMGFNDLRDKARAFIAAAKDSAVFDKIRAETDAKLAQQEEEMAQLRELVNQLTAKKSGRPKKELVE